MEKPNKILQEWIRNNPDAPEYWINICSRIEKSPDMAYAWNSLLSANIGPFEIVGMAICSFEESKKDIRRLPGNKERKSAEKVRNAAEALLNALREDQLLGTASPVVKIGDEYVTISWTDYATRKLVNGDNFGCPIVDLPGLLRKLQARCNKIINNPQINSIARQSDDSEWSHVRGFIRRLAWRFKHKYGQEMPENIARVTYAVFGLEEPLTGRDIEKILKDSPFRN